MIRLSFCVLVGVLSPHRTDGQLDFLNSIGQLLQPKTVQNPSPAPVENLQPLQKTGEACLPYVGELARLIWSNCKQRAETGTFLTWSKTINDAFQGGHISLDKAVKDTCRLTAERETCEKMEQRLTACDVFGVIRVLVEQTQLQQRCEQVKSFVFQPQQTGPNVGGLLTSEIAGGLLKRFLFGA